MKLPTDQYAALAAAENRLRVAGHPDTADDLAELVRVAEHFDQVPGLRVALHHARHAMLTREPQVGDRVRVTYPSGRIVTGEWGFDGKPLVQRDDDGQVEEAESLLADGVRVEVILMGRRLTGWRHHLDHASLILSSAWAREFGGLCDFDVDDYLADPLDGCHGCAGGEPGSPHTCDHSDSCTCLTVCPDREHTAEQARTRWCACGEASTWRVVAWSVGVSHAVTTMGSTTTHGGGVAELGDIEVAEVIPLAEPIEYAEDTVCSGTCARLWWATIPAKLADTLGEEAAGKLALHLRMEPWRYTPGPRDVPVYLAGARSWAGQLTSLLDAVADLWFSGKIAAADQRLDFARAASAHVIEHLVAIDSPGGTLWPATPVDLGESWTADQVHARIKFDPARYQVGDGVAYDRVDQVMVCTACGSFPLPTGTTGRPIACLPCGVEFDPARYTIGPTIIVDRADNVLICARCSRAPLPVPDSSDPLTATCPNCSAHLVLS